MWIEGTRFIAFKCPLKPVSIQFEDMPFSIHAYIFLYII